MNDNTRVIIVQPCERWPDGYIPIISCGGCEIRLIDSPFCKAQIRDMDSGMAEINENCPLPLLSQIKKYSSGEKPIPGMTVLIKHKCITDTGKTINRTKTGYYNGNDIYCWKIHGYKELRDKDIISWQELPQ